MLVSLLKICNKKYLIVTKVYCFTYYLVEWNNMTTNHPQHFKPTLHHIDLIRGKSQRLELTVASFYYQGWGLSFTQGKTLAG